MRPQMNPTDLFQKSLIVASHPDDEILWFSSILDKVDAIKLCFLGDTVDPARQVTRQRSLSEYPLKNVSCLGIEGSAVFFGVDWQALVATEYGIEIPNKKVPDKQYRENYHILKELLRDELADYRNVFTHNPWGEYGHPEHIQVYRVIKALQSDMKFTLWFTNYCSNLSCKLMVDFFDQFHNPEYLSFETNANLTNDIKMLYTRNNCWTWYDDWECFEVEAFIRDDSASGSNDSSKNVPVNFMTVKAARLSEEPDNTVRIFIRKVLRKTGLGMVKKKIMQKRRFSRQAQQVR